MHNVSSWDTIELELYLREGIAFPNPSYEEHFSLLFGERWDAPKPRLFFEEMACAAGHIEAKQTKLVFVAEYSHIFWNMELRKTSAVSLQLRITRLSDEHELLDFLLQYPLTDPRPFETQETEQILLRLDRQGCYRVLSIDGNLSRLVDTEIGDSATQLWQRALYFEGSELLDLCLRTNHTLRVADVALVGNDRLHRWVTMIPINHEERIILLSICPVSPEQYFAPQIHLLPNKAAHSPAQDSETALVYFESQRGMPGRQLGCNAAFLRLQPAEEVTRAISALSFALWESAGEEVCLRCSVGEQSYECTAARGARGDQSCVFFLLRRETQDVIDSLCDKLTAREYEIARHLCQGNPLRYIAICCGISEGTVKKTASNIYRKLALNGRVELMRLMTTPPQG